MARTVRAAPDAPFVVEGQALRIGVSIGIALNPACGASVDADTLLRQADIAMYTAKRVRDVSLLDTVVQLLDANDVSPTLLRIEVTESVWPRWECAFPSTIMARVTRR